jgi:DNA-binding CsgD family transcriptional regulator
MILIIGNAGFINIPYWLRVDQASDKRLNCMKNQKISDDLQIVRAGNGIKLIKADNQSMNHDAYTIGRLKDLPVSFYFLNMEGETCFINHEGARVCGFVSASQSVGKSLLDVSRQESAARLIHNCSVVIETDSIQIFEEENLRNDNVSLQFLSIKAPWYDEDNQIIGVMGCSIVVGQHSLSKSLSIVRKLGLMDQQFAAKQTIDDLRINNVCLTRRELQCLKLTVKGYTAKRIAKELAISHRTVEEYLNNIRVKTGASSKAELIEMTVENFYF